MCMVYTCISIWERFTTCIDIGNSTIVCSMCMCSIMLCNGVLNDCLVEWVHVL